jgi:hypothetical protein
MGEYSPSGGEKTDESLGRGGEQTDPERDCRDGR